MEQPFVSAPSFVVLRAFLGGNASVLHKAGVSRPPF
jgi:hypothetical protein